MYSTSQAAGAPPGGPPPASPAGGSDFEDFIYLISHDVRASVRALIELPQWIAEDLQEAGIPVEGSLATSMDLMNRHTGRLDRMLVDLLTYSRIGRMQETRCIDLEGALDQVLEEIQLPQGFLLVRDLACRRAVIGERDILTLLGGLIRNAVRHHDRAEGRISLSVTEEGAEIVIRVADDGPGVEEKFRDRVFDAMRTLKPRDEVEGSGMGLANVRKIAQLYRGSARLNASPFGRGCEVEVRLAALPPPGGAMV